MGRYKRLLSNTAVFGAGTFVSKLIVFLLMPFYTSLLNTSQFGQADILTQTANLIIPLASIGICDGIFRFALDGADKKADGEEGDGSARVFSTGIVILAVGSVLAAIAISFLGFFEVFDGYVWLITAYVICSNLHLASANFIRALGKTNLFAAQGILNTALTVIYNILFLVVFHMGVLGYVLSVVVADLSVTVFLVLYARLYRYFSPKRASLTVAKQMLRFSVPYIPTTIMWTITSASDRYIVAAYCGTAENGLYAAAYKLPTIIILVCGVFIEAWQFSTVKDACAEERSDFFSKVYKYYMGLMFLGGAMIIAFSKIMTRLLLADSYYSSWRYVPVLVVALVFSALVSFLGSVYFVEKKSVSSMLTAMVGAGVNVVLNFALIPTYGAMGAAVATFVSYLSVYVIRAINTRSYIKFDLHTLRVIINTMILFAASAVMIAEVKYWQLIETGLILVIILVNGRDIFAGIKKISQKFLKKF